jgi:hypothetical protein
MAETTQNSEGDNKNTGAKMVPESDLLAIKGSLEGQLKKHEEDAKTYLAAVLMQSDSTTTDLLKERAAKEQLEKQLQEAGGFKNQFEALSKKHDTLKASIPVLEKKATEAKRDLIALQYGVDVNILEGKTSAQLDDLKEALKIAGKGSRAGANSFYERGSSSGTPSHQPFAVEMKELEEIRKNP